MTPFAESSNPKAIPEDCQLQSYHYHLPPSLIAQTPAFPRDHSRLMVLHRQTKRWEHRSFLDLPDYLSSLDLIVANNSRVIPARFIGYRKKTQGKVEILLLEEKRSSTASNEPWIWEALMKSRGKIHKGFSFQIPIPNSQSFLEGQVLSSYSESPEGTVLVEFDQDPLQSQAGQMPLPPYIAPQGGKRDEASYQTLYAQTLGSVAAPTAGLHFTERIFEKLKQRQIQWKEISLHVGLGTFRPVKTRDIREHRMHEERFEIAPSVAASLIDWKRDPQRKLLAVGTTCIRTLEGAWKPLEKELQAGHQRTRLFFHPQCGKPFDVVDKLLTNFHLPESTLLMLVCAFAQDRKWILEAYQEAIREKYRFFSYGDAMLIL